jgi:hypothetical protein
MPITRDPSQFGLGPKDPGNLNTPEYYQNQRAGMVGGTGVGTQPNPLFGNAPRPDATQAGVATLQNPNPLFGGGGAGAPAQQPGGALGPMPDPDAIRRRLMGSVPGATDAAGMPYNAQFDQGVSNLYASAMAKLAGYDETENNLNTAYEKNRGYQLQNQDMDMKNLMDRMAFQGILSSGITTDQRGLLGQRYGNILDKLASTRAEGLNKVATGRLGAQSEYQQGLGNLESTYTGNLSKWVQDQAQQQAARQQQQVQDQANAQLLQQLNQMQQQTNQQMMQMQQPGLAQNDAQGNPIDWAAVAEAVKNGMNLPPGWRPA